MHTRERRGFDKPAREMKARIASHLLVVSAIWLTAAPPVRSQGSGATEMVRRYDRLLRGETNQWRVEMVVETPRWQRRYQLASWMAGEQKTLIQVLEPKKNKGQEFLKLGYTLWLNPRLESWLRTTPILIC